MTASQQCSVAGNVHHSEIVGDIGSAWHQEGRSTLRFRATLGALTRCRHIVPTRAVVTWNNPPQPASAQRPFAGGVIHRWRAQSRVY